MKMHRSTSILCGLAAAVTLGLSAAANAQATTDSTVRTTRSTTRVTSTRRIPVRKDGSMTTTESAGAMAKPNADSLARADSMARADAMMRAHQDSIAMAERMHQDSIAAMQRAHQDSIAMADRMRQDAMARADSLMRWNAARAKMAGTGFYFQVGGGTSIPRGNFDNFFSRNYDVTGSVGYHPEVSPVGVRFDVAYDRFYSRGSVTGFGEDPTALSGLAELTVKVPVMSVVSPYLIGGGGVTRFSHYSNTTPFVNTLGSTSTGTSMTKGQYNAGAGISFGVRMTRLFVESRYMHVATPGKATTFIPIIIGISL